MTFALSQSENPLQSISNFSWIELNFSWILVEFHNISSKDNAFIKEIQANVHFTPWGETAKLPLGKMQNFGVHSIPTPYKGFSWLGSDIRPLFKVLILIKIEKNITYFIFKSKIKF